MAAAYLIAFGSQLVGGIAAMNHHWVVLKVEEGTRWWRRLARYKTVQGKQVRLVAYGVAVVFLLVAVEAAVIATFDWLGITLGIGAWELLLIVCALVVLDGIAGYCAYRHSTEP